MDKEPQTHDAQKALSGLKDQLARHDKPIDTKKQILEWSHPRLPRAGEEN